MQEVLGLEHRFAVGIRRAVADIEDHGSAREYARCHLASLSVRLK
jgi:hypothetical protein